MKESRYNIWMDWKGATYVYNGVGGGLLKVPGAQREALRKFLDGDDDAGCSAGLLEQLSKGRMLVPSEMDEIAILKTRYELSRHDRSRFGLTIVTSLGCNFDCPYCFEAKHPSIMNDDVQRMVLEVVDDQVSSIKSLYVGWFGGEPLVGKESLFALSGAFIERCDRAGVTYSAGITTNGYLLDEATCRRLREHRVSSAQITLDGPPEVHDRMRPLAGGKGTFDKILHNLHHALESLAVNVRVNLDLENFPMVEELFQILAAHGFGGKLRVSPGQIVANDIPAAPSATYQGRCFSNRGYAEAELAFHALAKRYGLSTPSLPSPVGTPCTAVRGNELVVGSSGELYKCWESVGQTREEVGHIRDYRNLNGRLRKWLAYDPFANTECRGCIALPVCMGGCAEQALNLATYEDRCGTFRHTYREKIAEFIDHVERQGHAVPAESGALRQGTR